MKYKSTRGNQEKISFQDVILNGIPYDGGLYVPEDIPKFTREQILQMKNLSFVDLSYEIISKYISPQEIPENSLRDILEKSFASFRIPVAPTIQIDDLWILELFHGPTYSLKDFAFQFLNQLLEYFLSLKSSSTYLTVLAATLGDSGTAAMKAFTGKANINCFILYPDGIPMIHEKFMSSFSNYNTFCVAVKGSLEDAIKIVKDAFEDRELREEYCLCNVSSYNWARVLVQISYYFFSWIRVAHREADENSILINYCVPTGNFGNVLAGYYAKKMGLPIGQLVVCTNDNDALSRFLRTGIYHKSPSKTTLASSMDVSTSLNFERYLYYLIGEDSEKLSAWMRVLESTGEISVGYQHLQKAQEDFTSHTASREDILLTINETWKNFSYLLCPHSAIAVHAAKSLHFNFSNTICLATAHPAKFSNIIEMAVHNSLPEPPSEMDDVQQTNFTKYIISNNISSLKSFIHKHIGVTAEDRNHFYVTVVVAAVILIGLLTLGHRKY